MAAASTERKKRTITEIRDSKSSGEKMVYTSVLDYTSAKWAEAAGVDVCVVGDSLAMTCHGHPNTIPATVVLDREGRIAAVIRAAVKQEGLQPIVERIAAESPAPTGQR